MSRLRIAGIVVIGLGVASGIAENVFYGDIGPDGVLQESFFLPLTFILAAIGTVMVVASLFRSR